MYYIIYNEIKRKGVIKVVAVMEKELLAEYPDILTIPEVAKILRITRQSVYNYISEGRIKSKRFGSSARVLKRDLIDYIEGSDR